MKKILNALIGIFIITAIVFSIGIAEFQAIEKGSKGSRVIIIQEWLNKLGYDCGTADGSFGGKTEAAVKKFQEANNLDITGVVGEKTYNALLYQAGAFEGENDNDDIEIGSENNNVETVMPNGTNSATFISMDRYISGLIRAILKSLKGSKCNTRTVSSILIKSVA